MDGANIDLKGFSQRFYGKNCLAKLQPVLDTIKYVSNETDCHVELTTMLIEGENDSEEESYGKDNKSVIEFLSNNNLEIVEKKIYLREKKK